MAGLTGHPRLRAALSGGSAPPPGAPAGRQGRARLDPAADGHGLAVDGSTGWVSWGSQPAVTLRPPSRPASPPAMHCSTCRARRPDLSILCYPVLSFQAAVHQGSINNLLGASPSKELLARLSAELTATGDTPPAFIWHTLRRRCRGCRTQPAVCPRAAPRCRACRAPCLSAWPARAGPCGRRVRRGAVDGAVCHLACRARLAWPAKRRSAGAWEQGLRHSVAAGNRSSLFP